MARRDIDNRSPNANHDQADKQDRQKALDQTMPVTLLCKP